MKKIRWSPGADDQEGKLLEVLLPSNEYAYLQYLTKGNLGEFVRVLQGRFSSPISQDDLETLADGDDAFLSQCYWRELHKDRTSSDRGRHPVPHEVWERFAIRVAPAIGDLDESLFLAADGHVWRGRDVRENFPNVDLIRCPMSSCPSAALLLERIELDWTPAVSHERLWLRHAAEKRVLESLEGLGRSDR